MLCCCCVVGLWCVKFEMHLVVCLMTPKLMKYDRYTIDLMAGTCPHHDAITSRGRRDGFGALILWRTHWTAQPLHQHTHAVTHGIHEAHSSCQCFLSSSSGAAQPGLRPLQGQSVSQHAQGRHRASRAHGSIVHSVYSVCPRNLHATSPHRRSLRWDGLGLLLGKMAWRASWSHTAPFVAAALGGQHKANSTHTDICARGPLGPRLEAIASAAVPLQYPWP